MSVRSVTHGCLPSRIRSGMAFRHSKRTLETRHLLFRHAPPGLRPDVAPNNTTNSLIPKNLDPPITRAVMMMNLHVPARLTRHSIELKRRNHKQRKHHPSRPGRWRGPRRRPSWRPLLVQPKLCAQRISLRSSRPRLSSSSATLHSHRPKRTHTPKRIGTIHHLPPFTIGCTPRFASPDRRARPGGPKGLNVAR